MLQPEVYEEARRTADFHGQVRILNVDQSIQTPGVAQVTAEVVRSFRRHPAYSCGAHVRFGVSVLSGNEPWERVPIGGTRWTNYTELLRAKYMEIFLNGDPPACQVALWQSAIVEMLTTRPVLDAGNSIHKRSRRLWRWLRRIGLKGSIIGRKQ